MELIELTAQARQAIKLEQAHRFPELRYFPKPGDDGKPVKLPVVLGNPSGACRMPTGEKPSRAWGRKVAQTFNAAEEADWSLLVADCVLWPPPRVWASWLDRWPALADSVRPALVRKYGGAVDQIGEAIVEQGSRLFDALTAARAAAPGSYSLARFEAGQASVELIVKAPTSSQWEMFGNAMKRPDAKHWDLALELAHACTVESTMPKEDAFLRWPGLALLVTREASYLAGIATEYEEGEL